MSLIQRKPRPILSRDKDPDQLRDTRLFIVACDDKHAPKQYFGFFRLPRVVVRVVETPDGTSVAEHVLARLMEFDYEPDDELWMLLDTDHMLERNHIRGFVRALHSAKRRGVEIAISRPSFELWLLLHHEPEQAVQHLISASETESALRNALGGEYNKALLKETDFPMSTIVTACQRAIRLDGQKAELIPRSVASRVYRLWLSIVKKTMVSELPTELLGLVPLANED